MKNALLLAGLAATSLALPSVPLSNTHIVHERRQFGDRNFSKREAANINSNLAVRIALKQSNLDEGAAKLLDMSDPKSANYGQHMTRKQVADLFAADQNTIDTVKNWLMKSGIAENDIILSPTKTWLTVRTTVGKLQDALKTTYHIYENKASGSQHIGTEEYSLPLDITNAIDYVLPGASLAKIKQRATPPSPKTTVQAIKEPLLALTDQQQAALKTNFSSLAICDTIITPQCIKAIYNIPEGKGSNITNPMGIFESIGDVYAQEDLDQFFALVAPSIPKGTGPNLSLINGATAPNAPENAGGESDLDFEMAYPIIYPQTTTLFQVQGSGYDDIFGDFLSAIDGDYCKIDPNLDPHDMCGTFDTTSVISISYGGPEDETDVKGTKRTCNEFMKLGLIGVTTVVSSGDAGVADRGNYCWGPHHDIFVPDDLSSCPYITSVGSTTLPKGSKVGDAEIATNSFSSGGGFSNVFTTPSWQSNAVGRYLLRHNPNYFAYNTSDGVIPTTGGIYNRGGRAYPDVSALGDNGLVVVRGQLGLSGGTSMSAPIVGAIITRINEQRLSLGKGPVGFINPALYGAYDSGISGFFHDVVTGNQALGGVGGDRGHSACGNTGFSCVQGWDPVSGLGTPNYPVWEKYFVNL